MWTIVLGIFFILHGMVHLLYAGQCGRMFELRPGMVFPDGSWLLSKLLGDESTRRMAMVLLAAAALGFVASGLGLFLQQSWWRSAATWTAAFSTLVFLLLWDGKFRALDEKGWVGVLINLAIIFVVFVLKRP